MQLAGSGDAEVESNSSQIHHLGNVVFLMMMKLKMQSASVTSYEVKIY